MPVAQLADLRFYGNKVIESILSSVKFDAIAASPEPGHFYMRDGVLHFRTAANVELPVHENSITSVSGIGGIVVNQTGRAVTLEVSNATASANGLLSSQQYALLEGATPTSTPDTLVSRDASGNITANTITANRVTGLPENQATANAADGASVGYVNSLINTVQQSVAGRDFKDDVRVGLTTNIPLTSLAGIYDGVTLANGDSIALLNQADLAQNGIYTITPTGLVRRVDANNTTNLTAGTTFPVTGGTLAGRLIMFLTPNGYALNTDPLNFLVIDDSVSAGDGLVKVGSTIHAVGTANRVIVTADNIDIAPQFETNLINAANSGTWNGNTISIARGGTGATTADQALQNLGAVQEYPPFILGNGVDTEFTINGTWSNPRPDIQCWFQGQIVGGVEIVSNGNNSLTIRAKMGSTPLPTNSLEVVVRAKKY